MAVPASSDRWSAGALWLADCSPTPAAVLEAWAEGRLAAIAPGEAWWVAELPIQRSMHAIDKIADAGGQLGPVLAHVELDRAWWLVPPGAGQHLSEEPELVLHQSGWLQCPSPDRQSHGMGWIARPDGSGTLTELYSLAAACGIRWLSVAEPTR